MDFNRLFYQRLVGHISFPVFGASIIRFLFTSENFVFPLYLLQKNSHHLPTSARACVAWRALGWKCLFRGIGCGDS